MKKKLKLFLSISSLCFALAVLCFGVYAVQSVNYTLGGNILYEVNDAFVEVQTKIYSSPELMNGPTMLDKVYELGDADFNASETYTGLSFVKSTEKYSSVSDGNAFEDNTLDLTFNQDVKTYFIIINVKNLSSDINVWSLIDSTIFDFPENVLERDNAIQQNIGLLNADVDNKNVVIALSIKDQTKSIPQDSTFNIGIKIGTGDYSQTTENLNKLTFEENIQGETYQVTGVASNAGGVLVIPKTYNNLPVDYIMDDEIFEGTDTTISTIIINAELDTIGVYTFFNFRDLYTVIFPNSLQEIDENIFSRSAYVEHIYVPDGTTFTSYYNGEQVDAIINKTTKALIAGCSGTKFQILTGITSILNGAFRGCEGITSITIPGNVTSIGDSAFQECTSLISITISDSVTNIGNAAFFGCTGLTSIMIPDSVTSIGYSAFCGCTGLTTIEIPSSVTSIGDNAFSSCTSLASISIPNSVTRIGNRAFQECTSLASISIPNSVTSIGSYAFLGCTGLTQIINNSASITAYELPTISGKAWYKDSSTTATTVINGVGTYICK